MSSAKSQVMAVLENDTRRNAVVDKIIVIIGESFKEGPQYFRNFVAYHKANNAPWPRKHTINAALEHWQAGARLRIRRHLTSHRYSPLGHVWYLEFDSNEQLVEFVLRWS